MPKFHTLNVKEVRKETNDTVSVAFDVPNDLKADYQFIQGQYLTLKAMINGEEVRRSYSICSSPMDEELRVAIKKVEEGRFSTFANEVLKADDKLEVMTPMGRFYTEVHSEQSKKYVAFAAGSGITPIISIMKTVLETESESEFILFYGNQKTDTIIFKEAIDGLKNTNMQRLSVYHILSREAIGSSLFEGRIDKERCEKFCNLFLDVESVDEFFMCGPESMIFDVKDTLETLGVDKKKIHFELFTTSATPAPQKPKKKKAISNEDLSDITVILDSHSYQFQLGEDGENLLDAALKEGADLPFACKGGVCCTCRAKITEGTVDMTVNYALEPWEVEQGFVLACQAHPTSKKVVMSFDET
ncbi:MAG: 1,2-phenylacetyl-CoA epoxidase subunit PaaE [Saprospiraceae bacterium]